MADIRINALATTASASSSDDYIAVDGTTNGTRKLSAYSPTFGGSLTVSGGTIGTAASTNLTLNGGSSGASLVLGSGNNLSSITTPSGKSATLSFGSAASTVKAYVGTFSNSGYFTSNWYYDGGQVIPLSSYSTAGISVLSSLSANGSLIDFLIGTVNTAPTPVARITGTGNLLLGTTSDGGQKLQVAGTAEIQSTLTVKGAEAGPTTGISSIIQNTTSANDRVAALRLVNASNQWNLRAVGSGDTFSIGPGLSGSETNYFTLSSTGNATFAGKTYTASGAAATPAISFSGDTDTGFYNAGGNQMALACGGGQIWNTTVNGLSMASGKDIYLGNAYVAGAPTATGYVTIKDSNGTVYKVLVGT